MSIHVYEKRGTERVGRGRRKEAIAEILKVIIVIIIIIIAEILKVVIGDDDHGLYSPHMTWIPE